MKFISAGAIFLGILFDPGSGGAVAQTSNVDAKIQDSIIAALAVKDQRAVLGWRFIESISSTIDKTTATLNGKDLGDPPVQAYPAPDDTTTVIALLDIGDPRRADQIERGKVAMLLLREQTQPYHRLAFAVYGLEGNLLTAADNDPASLIRLLLQMPALDEPSNLSGAIVHSIRSLEGSQTSRRAIFVLTDGHNDGSIDLAAVRDLAVSTGVVIDILLFPGDRPVQLDVLEQMAVATGGQLIKPEALVGFLRQPFAALDSGGTQVFSLAGKQRLFWQSGSDVKAAITYGTKTIDLTAAADVPRADPLRTAEYLIKDHPVALAGSAVAALALLGGLAFFGVRRGRSGQSDQVQPVQPAEVQPAPPAQPGPPVQPAEAAVSTAAEPEPAPVLAVLQNIDDGTAYAINSPLANIGRATTNEIVIDDAAVSRRHAVLQQEGFGAFTIENLSGNGTFVNHRKIDKSPLVDGDLITMGSTTFRYAQSDPAERPAGR
jgi:hypothetical protein